MYFLLFFSELILLFIFSLNVTKSLSRLLFRITRSESLSIGIMAALFLPGVIIHELSHLLSASILFVRVGDIEFVPKLEEGRVKLGSVAVGETDPIRRAIIGFSPVLVGSAILIGALFLFTNSEDKGPLLYFLLFFVIFEVGNTMFSSRKDIEGTIELILAIAFIVVALYFLGFRIPQEFFNFTQSRDVVESLKTANFFLLVPILVDSSILLLIRILAKR